MKVKTSVTLSERVLSELDDEAERCGESRSALIEEFAADGLRRRRKREADLRDIEIYRTHAKELAEEALEVLRLQPLEFLEGDR